MSEKYPVPPTRPRVTPGQGVRLRRWATASYDPNNGRAAGVDEQKSYSWVGEKCTPAVQAPDGGFHALDRARTQNPTPVKDRKLG
jgi:hypothetical protein